MRKRSWRFLSIMIFLTLLAASSCAPTQETGGGVPRDQNPIQAALTATTLTLTTPTPVLFTDTPFLLPTDTPFLLTDTPAPTTTPTIDEQAVMLAQELAPQFAQIFGVQFNPLLAKGLDAAKIGGPAGQLAEMIAPVIDANQRYTDRNYQVREVEGILSLHDSRLDLEAMTIANKGTIQYFPLPLGAYMIACRPDRPNDCLAISLQGEEFQISPESVSITSIPPAPTGTPPPTGTVAPTGTPTSPETPAPTGTPCPIGMFCPTGTPKPTSTATVAASFTQIAVPTLTQIAQPHPPSVGFEDGSIRTCFRVLTRKICIKVF